MGVYGIQLRQERNMERTSSLLANTQEIVTTDTFQSVGRLWGGVIMAAVVADCRTFHTEAVTRNKVVTSFGAIRRDPPDNVSWNHAKYVQFCVRQTYHLDNPTSFKDLHCDWRLQSLLQFACVLSPRLCLWKDTKSKSNNWRFRKINWPFRMTVWMVVVTCTKYVHQMVANIQRVVDLPTCDETSVEFSRADRRVKMWRFSDVSGTDSVPIFSTPWRWGRSQSLKRR